MSFSPWLQWKLTAGDSVDVSSAFERRDAFVLPSGAEVSPAEAMGLGFVWK